MLKITDCKSVQIHACNWIQHICANSDIIHIFIYKYKKISCWNSQKSKLRIYLYSSLTTKCTKQITIKCHHPQFYSSFQEGHKAPKILIPFFTKWSKVLQFLTDRCPAYIPEGVREWLTVVKYRCIVYYVLQWETVAFTLSKCSYLNLLKMLMETDTFH